MCIRVGAAPVEARMLLHLLPMVGTRGELLLIVQHIYNSILKTLKYSYHHFHCVDGETEAQTLRNNMSEATRLLSTRHQFLKSRHSL